ncbi:MAG: hypothetical protein GF390_00265 [Candidatus Pacebacteria bacterium]|nr:hypothetical protein [Candidatus Paceibacterota bacterium]
MFNQVNSYLSLQDYFSIIALQTLESISLVLPRIAGALLALIVGVAVAKASKRLLARILTSLKLSSLVKNSPLGMILSDDNIGQKTEEAITTTFYWLVMLVVIHTMVSILGLDSLSLVIERILGYIPNIIAAVFIMLFGLLLAGWVENLVKGAVKSVDFHTSTLVGKGASYLVVSVAMLTALSELGIASSFITILFIGLVTTVSLGLGLSLGLGGQDLVRQILTNWYQRNFKPAKTKKTKSSKKKK